MCLLALYALHQRQSVSMGSKVLEPLADKVQQGGLDNQGFAVYP